MMWSAACTKFPYFMILLILGITDGNYGSTSRKRHNHHSSGKSNFCMYQDNINHHTSNITFEGSTITCKYENLTMTVVKMDMMNTTDHNRVKISAPKLSDDDPPIDAFVPCEPFQNVSKEYQQVCVMTYHSTQQFTNNPSTVLKSKVICVDNLGRKLEHMSNRLVINFTMNTSEIIPKNHILSCKFYNQTDSRWDDAGSFTDLNYFNSSNTVTCSYDHMTPFAVLLVDMTQIAHVQYEILSYISYIGCGLSSIFSMITILLYILMKKSNRDNSTHIHVSLSTAYFLLNTSFLLIEFGANQSQESVCAIIAVIIQYSLLSSFSWMVIEAVHLYLVLIKVFNTYIRHYVVKLSVFGWGVPAVLVGGSLCVYGSKPLYGTKQVKLSDTNETTQLCWITDTHFLYGMNITYFSLTYLFNVSILVAATRQIFKLRDFNIKHRKIPSHKDICTVLGLTILLGMTWGLAFFTSGYTNYAILYLFCICNTLQGLFLFVWVCGSVKRNRCLEAQTSHVSELTSTKMNS